jgi:hypothetical protein
MTTDVLTFDHWLAHAHVHDAKLTTDQRQLLQAAFAFLQHCGHDYYSIRLLSHFLLHCHSGLKVAAIARLLGISRATASAQQGLSSKAVVQAAHQRLAGRPHGKLLPRYAGPIAHFLLQNPKASRYQLLHFIERTWDVRVSRMALYRFLKKYGLLQPEHILALPAEDHTPETPSSDTTSSPQPSPDTAREGIIIPPSPRVMPMPAAQDGMLPLPSPDFFLPPPSTPVPFSSCPRSSTGSPPPRTASQTTTAPCGVDY